MRDFILFNSLLFQYFVHCVQQIKKKMQYMKYAKPTTAAPLKYPRCIKITPNCVLRSKVENSNSAYVKLHLYSINIPGFKRQIDTELSQQSQVQTNS